LAVNGYSCTDTEDGKGTEGQGTSKVLMDIWHLVVGNLIYVELGGSKLRAALQDMLKDQLQRIAEDLGRSMVLTLHLLR